MFNWSHFYSADLYKDATFSLIMLLAVNSSLTLPRVCIYFTIFKSIPVNFTDFLKTSVHKIHAQLHSRDYSITQHADTLTSTTITSQWQRLAGIHRTVRALTWQSKSRCYFNSDYRPFRVFKGHGLGVSTWACVRPICCSRAENWSMKPVVALNLSKANL